MCNQEGLENKTLGHGWTKGHCINQPDLDWIKSKLSKTIDKIWTKFINRAKEVGIEIQTQSGREKSREDRYGVQPRSMKLWVCVN